MAEERSGDTTRILLIGMVGAGKTTVGQELGARAGWPYVDNDDLVRKLTGREPSEIDATDGEDVLHLAEIDALDAALGLDPPVIVGVAGAVVTDLAAREALRDGGHVVWLRARPETLLQRIQSGTGRRVDVTDPGWLRAQTRAREPLYASVASQIIDVDDSTLDEIAERILEGLSKP